MAEPARGMGRGLAAILSVSEAPAPGDLRELPVDLIVPNPRQPRAAFDEEAVAALATSLKERGMLQPVLVRPRPNGDGHELIAGERRWRAAKLAGLDTIPAVVRDEGDAASLELALIENMAREDLNPVEEARACAALVEELGLTREAIGLKVGRSRVAVSNLMRLLDLPDEALELLESRELSEGHGRALLLCADHARRRQLALSAAEHGWSVREVERRAREEAVEVAAHSRAKKARHPDQEAAFAELADSFEAALGAGVSVTAKGEGYRVQIAVDSLEEARAALARLDRRAA